MLLTILPGISQVTIEGTVLYAPMLDRDLYLDFNYSEILDSRDLQNLLDTSFVTLSSNGVNITNPREQLGTDATLTSSSSLPFLLDYSYSESEVQTGEDDDDDDDDNNNAVSGWTSIGQVSKEASAGVYEVSLDILWTSENKKYGIETRLSVNGSPVYTSEVAKAEDRDYAIPQHIQFPATHAGGTLTVTAEVKSQKDGKWIKAWNAYLKVSKIKEPV